MITTSLIPLETIFPEECTFIIGFSYTAWTKNEVLAGSIADSAPFKFLPAHQYREVKGLSKKYGN